MEYFSIGRVFSRAFGLIRDSYASVGLLVLILAPECYTPFREFGAAYHASRAGVAAFERVTAIVDAPLAVQLPSRPNFVVNAGIGFWVGIVLSGLWFVSYRRRTLFKA